MSANYEEIRAAVMQAILDSNRVKAGSLLDEFAQSHGYTDTFKEILEPVLYQIGQDYASGKTASIAYGYIAAKVAEDLLVRMAPAVAASFQPPAPGRGIVVLGNIEDDYHALGRKMVGIFLRATGWEVRDLGNDVLAASFVDAAVEAGAKIIGVSAMMQTTALNILGIRNELDRRGLTGRIQLAVGGAIFCLRPELVQEVGGDGTAQTAFETPALMSELAARARVAGERP